MLPDLQSVCGFSCEDISSMFKELRGIGVVVKQLSHKLSKVVSSTGDRGSAHCHRSLPLFLSSPSFPIASSSRIPSAWPLVAVMDVPGQVLNETHVNKQICLAAGCICAASLESSNVLITVSVGDSFVLEPWQSVRFPCAVLSNPLLSVSLFTPV